MFGIFYGGYYGMELACGVAFGLKAFLEKISKYLEISLYEVSILVSVLALSVYCIC